MRFICLAFATLISVSSLPAYADSMSIGAGVEYFTWKEYESVTGRELLKETGPRYYLALDSTREMGNHWIYGFHGRIYSASVDYDGELQNGTPIQTTTDYSGVSAEMDFTWPLASPDWGFRYGLGFDVWRRHLLGNGGYLERYYLAYGRIGASYQGDSGQNMYVGVKLPLAVDERVDLTEYGYDVLKLKPQGDFSLFAQVRYPINRHWRVDFHYDSYRFKKSADVELTSGGISTGIFAHQPESRQDSFGVNLSYVF